MRIFRLKSVRMKIVKETIFIAPNSRPTDWREVDISQLDNWAVKQWRNNSFQSSVLLVDELVKVAPQLRKQAS